MPIRVKSVTFGHNFIGTILAWALIFTIGNNYDRWLKKLIFVWFGTFVRGFLLSIFISEIFERKKLRFKEDFWVFHNDSLGINYVDSYDGGLPFWTKSWPTGETCNFKNITSGTDRNEEIFQVVNKGGRSFEKFIYTCAFSGTLVPKRSISSISSRVVMVSKNCPQGLPLKFPGASFGAVKKFSGWFFIGSFTGSGPEMTIIVDSDRVQWSAKHWPFLVCPKFEKPVNVWPVNVSPWKDFSRNFCRKLQFFKVSRSFECLIFHD